MRNDGGPAFARPAHLTESGLYTLGHEGVSLRDYFAAKAMQGYCSLPWESVREWVVSGAWPERVAAHSYLVADAMLKARESDDA